MAESSITHNKSYGKGGRDYIERYNVKKIIEKHFESF